MLTQRLIWMVRALISISRKSTERQFILRWKIVTYESFVVFNWRGVKRFLGNSKIRCSIIYLTFFPWSMNRSVLVTYELLSILLLKVRLRESFRLLDRRIRNFKAIIRNSKSIRMIVGTLDKFVAEMLGRASFRI